jgi:hypothetical protein
MVKNFKEIIATAKQKGYTIDTRPYKLNLIGVRNSKATNQDEFDDVLAYFYYDENGKLNGKIAPATTDPSTYFLKNPINGQAAGILQSGEYKDAYSIGVHRGKYTALIQTKPVTTIRDSDRDAYINYLAPTTTGLYGINIHHATLGKKNIAIIDKDSAGCQVFRDIDDFNQMMGYAQTSKGKYGNKFSYILLDERDGVKFRNTSALVIGIALVIGAIYFSTKK